MPTAVASLGGLQKAIFTLLKANAPFMAKLKTTTIGTVTYNGLYDHVPEGALFPYVTFFARDKPWFNQGRRGREATLEFEVWSRYSGFAEANDIVDVLVTALDHATVAVAGFAQTELVLDPVGPQQREPDGLTRHIAVYFVAHLEQT